MTRHLLTIGILSLASVVAFSQPSFRYDGYQITIDEIVGWDGGYFRASEGFSYVAINIAVRNVISQSLAHNPLQFKLKDDKGYVYLPSIMNGKNPSFKSGSIYPDEVVKGYVTFEVKRDFSDLVLQFLPDAYSRRRYDIPLSQVYKEIEAEKRAKQLAYLRQQADEEKKRQLERERDSVLAVVRRDSLVTSTVDRADSLFRLKEYSKSIEYYQEALNTHNSPANPAQSKLVLAYRTLGGAYAESGEYSRAIEAYNAALGLIPDEGAAQVIKESVAECYYRTGVGYGSRGEHSQMKRSFKAAIEMDPALSADVTASLQAYKRPPLLYGALSLITGLGQVAFGETSKGIVHFVLAAGCYGIASRYERESYSTYHEYLRATDRTTAMMLYEDANTQRATRDVFLGLGLAVAVYSIYDAISDVVGYNNNLTVEVTTKGYGGVIPPVSRSIGFDLRIGI